MLTKKEVDKIGNFIYEKLGEDFDKFDSESEIDHSLTLNENLRIIEEKIKPLIEELDLKKAKEEYETEQLKAKQEFTNRYLTEKQILSKEVLDKFKVIAVYGDTGSGKTALSYKIIEQFSDKRIYFIKHPKPELIRSLGYANLTSIEEIGRLKDCVVYFDEPQLSVALYDNHTNRIISNVCSLARQNNIKLIISSSDTRCFTKHNEAYFDLFLVKDVDFEMVKNGSKIKKAIKNNSLFDPNGFRLEMNEFLVENRRYTELNGKHNFDLPKVWNDKLSKAYRNSQ